MSLRRLGEGQATQSQGVTSETPFPTGVLSPPGGNGAQVMPAGPGLDVSSILEPLIDGSFAHAQGQAAIMSGVRGHQQGDSTMPLSGTAPLDGLGAPAPAG